MKSKLLISLFEAANVLRPVYLNVMSSIFLIVNVAPISDSVNTLEPSNWLKTARKKLSFHED